MKKNSLKHESGKWGFAFALSLPVLIFFLAYFFNHDKSLTPTGFIQYDNVTYAGNARELLHGHSGLFYSNRLNDSDRYPRIYFQPQHVLLAAGMKAGLSPGMALCLFTCIFSVVFFRLLILLYESLYPVSRHSRLVLVLFSWGGGLLAVCGWLLFVFHLSPAADLVSSGLSLDPSNGWWGLNLGRSLFFSMEAFYHVLFFSGIYGLVKKKWLATALIAFVLSLSHPFTGLEFLAIVCLWIFVEKVFYKNGEIPWSFVFFIGAVAAFHLWLYLVHLDQYPEHKIVFLQYQLDWKLRFYNMIPAYGILATLAVLRFRRKKSPMPSMDLDNTRLLLCWLAGAFVLANHEWFVPAAQPLHFTRGYIWAPLFLLAVPVVESLISRLQTSPFKKILLGSGITLLLLDNINWIYLNSRYTHASDTSARYIDPQQRGILEFLARSATSNTLIIGSDKTLPYLCTVYTPAYAWISHRYNTPFYDEKLNVYHAYLQTGTLPAAWVGRSLLFIAAKNDADEMKRYFASGALVRKVYETGHYLLYTYAR